ncbi:MAG: hypothetical protein ACK41D_07905 [Rubricoccaceae bacterium]
MSARLALLLCLGAGLGACRAAETPGAPAAEDARAPTADGYGRAPAVEGVGDTLLVTVLADLHLADARAETTGEPAGTLRARALAAHGLDEEALQARLRRATRTPDDAARLYDAVSYRLALARP